MASPPQSAWSQLGIGVYVHAPQESGPAITLVALLDSNTHQVSVSLINALSTACSDGGTEDLGAMGIYNIAGTPVKMRAACLNGVEIDQPSSDAGKKLLNDVVAAEKPFAIDTGNGHPFHYNPAGFGVIQKQILATKNAL